ncbi:MAG: hypothetical protein GXP45_02610 [bacterium]|nr:hypothetical protein [bacterium]
MTRYFGGTKLGIGGLIQAYTQTSKAVLKQAEIVVKPVLTYRDIELSQEEVPAFLNYCRKHQIFIIQQKYSEKAQFTVAVNRAFIEIFSKEWP